MEKIKIILRGQVRENYYTYFYGDVIKLSRPIDYEQIYSGEINRPPFEKDEEVYINDLNLTVIILKRIRTVTDEYLFDTNHVIKTIDTEYTEKTRVKSLELKDKYDSQKEPEKTELQPDNKKWYQFWK